jgi:hypothetical protein
MGTGQMGLVTFPPACDNTAGATGLATAKVTETVRIRTRTARRDFSRKFKKDEVILIVLPRCKRSYSEEYPISGNPTTTKVTFFANLSRYFVGY